jgi:hypothetical protein
MGISTEGNIGIGLTLVFGLGTGAVIVAPDAAKPIGWAMIIGSVLGLILMAVRHGIDLWGGRHQVRLLYKVFALFGILIYLLSVTVFFVWHIWTNAPPRVQLASPNSPRRVSVISTLNSMHTLTVHFVVPPKSVPPSSPVNSRPPSIQTAHPDGGVGKYSELIEKLRGMARALLALDQNFYAERNQEMNDVGYSDEKMHIILHREETPEEKLNRYAAEQQLRTQFMLIVTQKWEKIYIEKYRTDELSLRSQAYDALFLTPSNMPELCKNIELLDKSPGNFLAGGHSMLDRANCLLELYKLLGGAPIN